MKRNMVQIIKNTKVKKQYDINTGEMQLLKEQFEKDGDLFSLMSNLFVYGYAMGTRSQKANQKQTTKSITLKNCSTVKEFYQVGIKDMVDQLSEEDSVFFFRFMGKMLAEEKKKAANCN